MVTPDVSFKDLGGIESCMQGGFVSSSSSHSQDIRELVELTFTHGEIFEHLGTAYPRGILLHGPPGWCTVTLR